MIEAGQRLGVRDAVPQLQRARVQRRRLAVGVDRRGGLGGANRCGERRRLVAGLEVVIGDSGGEVRAAVIRAGPRPAAPARAPAPDEARRARPVAGRRRPPRAAARAGTRRSRPRPGPPAAPRPPRATLRGARGSPRPRRRRGSGDRAGGRPRAAAAAPGRPSDSRSIRSISASRSVGGNAPRPSIPAASSSSANSGLPSERANSRSSRSSRGDAPRMSSSCWASSTRVSGCSSTRSARASRSSSASSGRSGWRRCSSSGR